MDSNIIVTIGIPIYNAEKFLESAIKSVLNQKFTKFELILTDDGSTDRSLEIAKSFSDTRITVLSDNLNKGIGYRLNEQIGFAKGKYFARMDADDVMFPERIEEQVNYLESRPDLDAIGGWAVVINEENEILGLRKSNIPKEFSDVLNKSIFIHPTVMGKIEWFREYKYNPEISGPEDYDLWLRSFNGSHFAIINKPILFYRDPLKIRLTSYLSRQKQIRLSYINNQNLIKKSLILKLCFISFCKSLIYWVFELVSLDYLLIRKRNLILAKSEKKFYKDQLNLIVNKTLNGIV